MIPIKVKIAAAIIIVILLLTVPAAVSFILYRNHGIRELEEKFLSDAMNDVETLAYLATPHLIENDYVFTNNLVSHEKRHSNRVYVSIEDNNKIMAHSSREKIGGVFGITSAYEARKVGDVLLQRYYEAGRGVIDVSYPVRAGDLVVGTARIGLDTDWLQKEIDRSRQMAYIFSLAVFGVIFLGSIMALKIAERIAEPILLLKEAAEKVGKGEYDQEVYVESNDEVGNLAASFNRMVMDLKNLRAELVDKESLDKTLSLLTATLESTADGILVVDTGGKMVSYNQKFIEMWRIPKYIIDSRDNNQALAFVLEQLKAPDEFLKKVRELYAQPDAESFDMLDFKDGRVFERYSRPQIIGGSYVGRVWSFRDVTERKKTEGELEERMEELEKFYDMAVNRELRMKELKEEIASLKADSK